MTRKRLVSKGYGGISDGVIFKGVKLSSYIDETQGENFRNDIFETKDENFRNEIFETKDETF